MGNTEEFLNEENFMVNQPKLLGAIDKILIKRSIAKRVSDIQLLSGPVGIITGVHRDKANDKMLIAKSNIEVTSKRIRTEFSIESLQDMQAIYGESFYDILAYYLVDEMAYKIDEEFITLIRTRAHLAKSLAFDNSFDKDLWAVGQSIAISINKGLSDLPISDNRSPMGWAIVSSNVGSVLSLTTDLSDDSNGNSRIDDSPSYMGRLSGVDYYIDYTHPNDGVDSVIYGIKGNGISKGSTIFAPYKQEWIDTVSSETGEKIFFMLERSGVAVNPLDEKYYNGGAGQSGFIGKLNVDLSGMTLFA